MSKSTAIVPAKLSVRERINYIFNGAPVVVSKPAGPEDDWPDATVSRRQIALYRPPTALTPEGHALPGISKELFAHYLVSTVEGACGGSFPNADVDFGEVVGRFATVYMTLTQWGSQLTFIVPIGIISQEIKEALDNYMAGVALKAGQSHRGHQDHTSAYILFDRAVKQLQALRDDDLPHYNTDAEYIFLVSNCQRAQRAPVLTALPGTDKILDR